VPQQKIKKPLGRIDPRWCALMNAASAFFVVDGLAGSWSTSPATGTPSRTIARRLLRRMRRIENSLGPYRKRRALKIAVIHVARHAPVVLGYPLKLIRRVRRRGLEKYWLSANLTGRRKTKNPRLH